jgi:hypothetical protein
MISPSLSYWGWSADGDTGRSFDSCVVDTRYDGVDLSVCPLDEGVENGLKTFSSKGEGGIKLSIKQWMLKWPPSLQAFWDVCVCPMRSLSLLLVVYELMCSSSPSREVRVLPIDDSSDLLIMIEYFHLKFDSVFVSNSPVKLTL